jgi:hypothetical protein
MDVLHAVDERLQMRLRHVCEQVSAAQLARDIG